MMCYIISEVYFITPCPSDCNYKTPHPITNPPTTIPTRAQLPPSLLLVGKVACASEEDVCRGAALVEDEAMGLLNTGL